MWYLVDGQLVRSLGTTKKGLAQHLLEQHIKGKFGLKPTPTVREVYDRWIEGKVEPLYRRSLIRAYKQHFRAYILPRFGDLRLSGIGTDDVEAFRLQLLRGGHSVATCRNIIDASFRAYYRDARRKHDELKGLDPFMDLQWPRQQRRNPDPFTMEERDTILAQFRDKVPFFYPWVLFQFSTGARPSEGPALLVTDVVAERCEINITKSRNLQADNAPKTAKSHRKIQIPVECMEALLSLPSWLLGADSLFLNKHAGQLNANNWARDYWRPVLKACGVRYRKFYATRHTFITEQLKRGEFLKAVADYCGTSIKMIEENYSAVMTLSDRTVFEPLAANYAENKGSAAGCHLAYRVKAAAVPVEC